MSQTLLERPHVTTNMHEFLPPREQVSEEELRHILRTCKTIAVLGLHATTTKAAYYVPEFLHRRGYTIFPVNPQLPPKRIMFGQRVSACLTQLSKPVDIVQIFRRSEAISEHLTEILRMNSQPKVVWMQQGVSHHEVAETLRLRGIKVVQDRCMMADYRDLL